jgi:hypothetical protein
MFYLKMWASSWQKNGKFTNKKFYGYKKPFCFGNLEKKEM